MKKNIKLILGLFVVGLFFATSCDEQTLIYEPVELDKVDLSLTYLLGSPNKTVVVDTKADKTSFTIDVVVWGGVAEADITIPFEILDTDLPTGGLTVVGSGFIVKQGSNSGSITLELNRDKITPGVVFNINYKMGAPSSGVVNELGASGTITTFNPGPLAPWVGSYTVDAASYGDPGNWDEEWIVTTELDPNDPLNNLLFNGIGGGDVPIIGTIDVANGTVSFEHGQNIGNAYGYGDTFIYNSADYGTALTGTVDATTGEILVDNWGHLMSGDYAGYSWDEFNCTFAKDSKKSSRVGAKVPSIKEPRLIK